MEREAFPIANLADKIEKGWLDQAPIFTDVCTFPWESFAPYMGQGILSFGFPCQPFSVAGKRKAAEDDRWLFDIIADGIAILKPRILFAENVEGLLSAKMPDGSLCIKYIIERLEAMGYSTTAGLFSAEEVGAPHRRKRIFIMAHNVNSSGLGQSYKKDESGSSKQPNSGSLRLSEGVAHSDSNPDGEDSRGNGEEGCISEVDRSKVCRGMPTRAGKELANSNSNGGSQYCLSESIQEKYSTTRDSSNHLWPSRPNENQYEWEEPRVLGNTNGGGSSFDGKIPKGCRSKEIGGKNKPNSPSIGGGKIESSMGRTSNGVASRVDSLRLLGNGVVPQTAELAFKTLWKQLIIK